MTEINFAETIKLVKTYIAAKEYQEANRLLRKVVDYPTDFIQYQETFPVIIDTFIALIENFNIPDALKAAKALQVNGLDAEELFNLAYALINAEWPEFAANIFRILYESGTRVESVVTEYAVALERSGWNEKSMNILQENLHIVEKSLYFSYVLAFNAMNSGYPIQTKKAFELMKKNYDSTQEYHTTFLERIRNFIARYDRLFGKLSIVNDDLRQWHYILNGSIVLYYSPYGWEQMHGRFGLIQESIGTLKIGLTRMAEAIQKLNLSVEHILYVDNYQSKILAKAFSELTKIPLKEISEKNANEKGLVVLYKRKNMSPELYEQLQQKHEGQYLWVHSWDWVNVHGYEADFITHLSQMTSDPWEPSFRYNSDHSKSDEPFISKDTDTAVKALLEHTIDKKEYSKQDDFNHFLDVIRKTAKDAPFLYETEQRRNRSYRVSVVKSNAFRG